MVVAQLCSGDVQPVVKFCQGAIPTLRTPFAGVAMHIAEGRPVGSRCLELAEIRGLGKAQTFILKVNFVSASVEDTSISPPCDLAISAAI
jgi:hypothetical protein